VMDIIVTHGSPTPASSVRIDSLSLELSLSDGAPAFPGDYFSAMIVTHDGDTVCRQSSLSGASPLVGCPLDSPVVVMPLESETLSVCVDTKALFSPANVEVRIDQPGLVVRDTNDGTRIFGLEGEFPFIAGPASLRLPTNGVSTGLISRASANVTANEPNLEVFDFLVKNGQTAGFTSVELTNLRVRVESAKGETIDPGEIASGARLVTSDSTVIDGTMSSSDISFALPAGVFLVASGTSDTASVLLDIDTGLGDTNFRLAIEDATSVEVLDGVTANRIPAGTTGGGFPLVTRWIHVLGASAQGAYTNYPNPFAAGREKTVITYYLEKRSAVTLKLYTLWGAPVLTMIDNESQPPGLYQNVEWDGRNGDGDVVNNGVYYLVLEIRGDDGANATLKRKVGVIR
jgi:hypothetical protein